MGADMSKWGNGGGVGRLLPELAPPELAPGSAGGGLVSAAAGSRKRDLLVRLRNWPANGAIPSGPNPSTDMDVAEPDIVGFVVRLAVDVPDLHAALAVAERLCLFVEGTFPQVVAGVTTVSRADHQTVRHRVFCDRVLPDRIGRCGLRHQHRGSCTPR